MKQLLIMIIAWSFAAQSFLCWSEDYDTLIETFDTQLSDKQNDLRELQLQIDEIKKEHDTYLSAEQDLEKKIAETKKNLAHLEQTIGSLSEQLDRQEQQQNKLAKKIESTKVSQDYWRDEYSQSVNGYYLACVGWDDPDTTDHMTRIYREKLLGIIATLVQREQQTLSQSQQELEQLVRERDRLSQEYSASRAKQKQVQEKKTKTSQEYEQACLKREECTNELATLRRGTEALLSLIQEIENKRLLTLKEKKAAERAKRKMTQNKGELPWPVHGSIISSFGKSMHPELKTYIYNEGIKIKSTKGTDVHAVSKGTVVFAGVFGSFGKMIIIDHRGGYYTVYGNLDQIHIQTNDKVDGYALIGKLNKTEPILYFEIREKETPQNPVAWLSNQ
ncbi:MAG: peptidoglycan DD-metalloendopeptidase family protein [Elusimicrobia bacterium]|nr:peptidoglycan DD-metalloendopeptidase family protein [Elusimicrobiota bacterium]MBD3412616.1 peptidoglycan DD-metalloendopeptidase family protein [Elusimicrobiota bacterium]